MTFKNVPAFLAVALMLSGSNTFAQNISSPLAAKNNVTTTVTSHYAPWTPIKESDIIRKKRIWEDISLSEKNNNIFGTHNSGTSLLQVLINGVMDGKIPAYSEVNDRFTTVLTPEEFSAISERIKNGHSPVTRYMIKEDSIWLNTGEVVVRILGIAPFSNTIELDGVVKEQPLFWIFYPACRSYLSEYTASGSYSWDDILEGRYFTGQVVRVSEYPLGKWIIEK